MAASTCPQEQVTVLGGAAGRAAGMGLGKLLEGERRGTGGVRSCPEWGG